MGQRQSLEVLAAIEQGLARHPVFGDSTYILDQLQVCLGRRLNAMSARLPIAGRLSDALSDAKDGSLHHVIGDTVVRCAVLHAHSQLEIDGPFGLPLADCEEVFEETIRRIEQRRFSTPLDDGSLRRLGSEPYHGWLWSEEHSGDVFGRSFRYLMKDRYGAIPRTPTSDEIATLTQGAQLLETLSPLLTPNALRHAHVIACVPDAGGWKKIASSSQFHLGGTIFLGCALHGPWWAAEHLLHESLHQKLYDFRHGHSVQELELELGSAKDDAPKVCSPWNPQRLNKSNHWDVNRVYAAFHVYVHLAYLAMVAEQRAPELEDRYGPIHGMIESGKNFERAHYLGEKLKEQCWDYIGPAGRNLADWLISVLEFLNPAPPPKGAFIHLYLDHYRREGKEVVTPLSALGSAQPNLSEKLKSLATEEVDEARAILSAVGARQDLERFNEAVGRYTQDDLGTKFPELRRLIGTTLVRACPDGYRLTESGEQDGLVREMIERASQRVFILQSGYPPAVADAKRRAHELRFMQSCDDDVGRLLTVLACATPRGGRILEIGAGTGVGVAWIAAGLGERTDVEIVSVEVDPKLSDAARTWPWPAHIRIVTADALETLGTLGTYDLVFADAAPIKYGHIDSVLGTLRPGGLLVLDDLRGGMRTDEAQRAEKDALRATLLRHPEVHAVEFDWASGVILAAKFR
jgi:predicted O-methyltransferase YrrM